jgi:hypothetical protein
MSPDFTIIKRLYTKICQRLSVYFYIYEDVVYYKQLDIIDGASANIMQVL